MVGDIGPQMTAMCLDNGAADNETKAETASLG